MCTVPVAGAYRYAREETNSACDRIFAYVTLRQQPPLCVKVKTDRRSARLKWEHYCYLLEKMNTMVYNCI